MNNGNNKNWYEKTWVIFFGILSTIGIVMAILSDGGQVYDRYKNDKDCKIIKEKLSSVSRELENKISDYDFNIKENRTYFALVDEMKKASQSECDLIVLKKQELKGLIRKAKAKIENDE